MAHETSPFYSPHFPKILSSLPALLNLFYFGRKVRCKVFEWFEIRGLNESVLKIDSMARFENSWERHWPTLLKLLRLKNEWNDCTSEWTGSRTRNCYGTSFFQVPTCHFTIFYYSLLSELWNAKPLGCAST